MSDPVIRRVRRSIDESRSRKGMICGMPKVTIDASDAERICILAEGLIKATSEAGWHERQKWDSQAQAERLQSDNEALRAANRDLQAWFDDARDEAEKLQGRVSELFTALSDAQQIIESDANTEENHGSLCRIGSALAGNPNAWLLRKQAEAVKGTWHSHCRAAVEEDCEVLYQEDMQDAVNNLRQQADEAADAGGQS